MKKIQFNFALLSRTHAHGHMERCRDAQIHSFSALDILHICTKLQLSMSPQSKDICTQMFTQSTLHS